MLPVYKTYCRIHQQAFRCGMYLLPWREPELCQGRHALRCVPGILKENGLNRPLIITDPGIVNCGLLLSLTALLDDGAIPYEVYSDTIPNPTIINIEEARSIYLDHGCDSLIAIGGGSSMDCAKGAGARIARPEKTLEQMRGQLRIHAKLPILIAIPTTSGSGSEVTLAAVITNPETHEKYPVNDPCLIPHYAILDPLLVEKLPKSVTAMTGMDALTHAIEAYIGHSNTRKTKQQSLTAARLVHKYLYSAYRDGSDLKARAAMQKAAYLAGCSFTRAYVGYVHALAHALGALYNMPHGLANAILLPHVLEYYGRCVTKPLADIASAMGIASDTSDQRKKAALLIKRIRELNRKMEIPDKIKVIRTEDIDKIVEAAFREANPLYPVPKILSKTELKELLYMVREE